MSNFKEWCEVRRELRIDFWGCLISKGWLEEEIGKRV